MEQILIEAQTRKLLAEQIQPKNENEATNESSEKMEVDPAEDESIKKEEEQKSEDAEIKEQDKEGTEEESKSSSKDESDDNNNNNEESDDLTIDIDPKTYCKLGHFHLLLGDFAKGLRLHYCEMLII